MRISSLSRPLSPYPVHAADTRFGHWMAWLSIRPTTKETTSPYGLARLRTAFPDLMPGSLPFCLFSLPQELRLAIYELVFDAGGPITIDSAQCIQGPASLLFAIKQINREVRAA